MGMIFEKRFFDYKKAKEYYQKSKEQMSNIQISRQTDEKLKKLESFLFNDRETFLADSLFILAKVPDTAIVYNFDVHITSKAKDSALLFSKMEKDTALVNYN